MFQARLFDEPQLASLCLENIDKNTGDALAAEGFTDIDLGNVALWMLSLLPRCISNNSLTDHWCLYFVFFSSLRPLDTLVAVLERDTLGVREVRLFGAAVRWAEAEAHRQQLQPTPENKRKVLGKALTLIRFPLMTIEEFAAGEQKWSKATTVVLISCLPCLILFSPKIHTHFLCLQNLICGSCLHPFRSSPVQYSDRPRGGESLPSLHCEPKASCRFHWSAALLPPREGVQHYTFWTGGEPLGLQWDKRPHTVSEEKSI